MSYYPDGTESTPYWGGAPQGFPNNMMGNTSNDYSRMYATFDRMHEEANWAMSQNMGARSLIGPFGNIGGVNPMVGMAMAMAASPYMGTPGKLLPWGGYTGTDLDYVGGRERMNDLMRNMPGLLASNPLLGAIGPLGRNPFVQQMVDQFIPNLALGGSRFGAMAQMLGSTNSGAYGSLATANKLAGTNMSNMLADLQPYIRTGDSVGMYNHTYGFNLEEIEQNRNLADKFGIAGVHKDFEDGRMGRGMAGFNSLAHLVKGMYGEVSPNSMQQVSEAMGGMSGHTSGESTNVLNQIQSVSRTLDVDQQVFAQYVAVRQKIAATIGMNGISTSNSAMSTAVMAKAMALSGQETGDTSSADMQQNMSRLSNSATEYQNSYSNRLRIGVNATYARMTDDQRGVIVEGTNYSLAAAQQRVERLNASGHTLEATQLLQQMGSTIEHNEMGHPFMIADNPTPGDTDRANKVSNGSLEVGLVSKVRAANQLVHDGILRNSKFNGLDNDGRLTRFLSRRNAAERMDPKIIEHDLGIKAGSALMSTFQNDINGLDDSSAGKVGISVGDYGVNEKTMKRAQDMRRNIAINVARQIALAKTSGSISRGMSGETLMTGIAAATAETLALEEAGQKPDRMEILKKHIGATVLNKDQEAAFTAGVDLAKNAGGENGTNYLEKIWYLIKLFMEKRDKEEGHPAVPPASKK